MALKNTFNYCDIPNRKVLPGRYWVKTKMCFLVKIPLEWDINQPARWNLCRDTVWRSYMAKKRDFEKHGCQVGEMKKIGFTFSTLAEWFRKISRNISESWRFITIIFRIIFENFWKISVITGEGKNFLTSSRKKIRK